MVSFLTHPPGAQCCSTPASSHRQSSWRARKGAKFNNRNLTVLQGNGCLREAVSQKTPLLIVVKKKGELDAGSCNKLPCSLKPSTQLPPSPRLCLSLGQSPEHEDAAAASAHGCPCTVLGLSPHAQSSGLAEVPAGGRGPSRRGCRLTRCGDCQGRRTTILAKGAENRPRVDYGTSRNCYSPFTSGETAAGSSRSCPLSPARQQWVRERAPVSPEQPLDIVCCAPGWLHPFTAQNQRFSARGKARGAAGGSLPVSAQRCAWCQPALPALPFPKPGWPKSHLLAGGSRKPLPLRCVSGGGWGRASLC